MSWSNNNAAPTSSQQPTMTTEMLVALTMTIRRLVVVWGALPFLTVASPVLSNVGYFVLNGLTKNHAILSILLTLGMTNAFRNLVRTSAPSKQAAEESLVKCQFWLPVIMFLVSALMIRGIIEPLGPMLGITNILTWSPRIAVFGALNIATGMCFLGLGVIARYVGPSSVVRCSSSPLMSYPTSIAMRAWWSKASSFDTYLDFIAGPSDTHNEPMKPSSTQKDQRSARRLQGPSLGCFAAQIVVSSLIGLAVAFTTVLPFSPRAMQLSFPHRVALIMTSILTTLLHLILTALNGSSHELNPKRYLDRRSMGSLESSSNHPWIQRVLSVHLPVLLKSLLPSAILVAGLSIAVSGIVRDDGDNKQGWNLLLVCILTGVLIASYLQILDEVIKYTLCAPGTNVMRLVEEVSDDDGMDTHLEVIMSSVLHGSETMIKQLSSSLNKPGYFDVQDSEKMRHEEYVKAMAETLLTGNREDVLGGAKLEKDVLRHAILESFGGASSDGLSYGGLEGAGERHVDCITRWVQPGDRMKIGGTRSEPCSVLLVRTFCTYAGGLGEALAMCSTQLAPPFTQHGGYSKVDSPWLLPPGAIVSAEYCILAAARCISWNFSNLGRSLADWRSTHLSMLVPVVLKAAYRLQSGVVKYSQSSEGGSANYSDQFEMIKTGSPELISLFSACNHAALMVLRKLEALEGVRNTDLELEGECNQWTTSLLTRHS